MAFELAEYNCSDLISEAYVADNETYEGGDTELDVADMGEVLLPLLLFVFIITSSNVCTNSSVFVFKYWFDAAAADGVEQLFVFILVALVVLVVVLVIVGGGGGGGGEDDDDDVFVSLIEVFADAVQLEVEV